MKTIKGTVVMGMLLVSACLAGAQTAAKPSTPPSANPPLPPALPPGQARVIPATPRPATAPAVTPSRAPFTPPGGNAYQSIPGYTPPGVATAAPAVTSAPDALKWDADQKEYSSKPGESEAHFTFNLTNVSSSDVLVHNIRTSCGCTAAKLPSQPWTVKPTEGGPIEVTMNLAGKSGAITKAVTVETSAGTKTLLVKVNIPAAGTAVAGGSAMGDTERLKNMQSALADRQVVFKNQDCAKCHADPARDKTDGRQIYAAACAICHESHIRAAMVPDLKRLTNPNVDAEYWRNWVKMGKSGSMMPAFAQSEGGPLSDQQIDALVEFLVRAFPARRLPGVLAPGRVASPTAQLTPTAGPTVPARAPAK